MPPRAAAHPRLRLCRRAARRPSRRGGPHRDRTARLPRPAARRRALRQHPLERPHPRAVPRFPHLRLVRPKRGPDDEAIEVQLGADRRRAARAGARPDDGGRYAGGHGTSSAPAYESVSTAARSLAREAAQGKRGGPQAEHPARRRFNSESPCSRATEEQPSKLHAHPTCRTWLAANGVTTSASRRGPVADRSQGRRSKFAHPCAPL
jgi:hypothetical protein